MSKIKSKDDLRALSRGQGMTNAAAFDMQQPPSRPDLDEVYSRVAAARLRKLGVSEEQIIAQFGYSPEPIEKRSERAPSLGM